MQEDPKMIEETNDLLNTGNSPGYLVELGIPEQYANYLLNIRSDSGYLAGLAILEFTEDLYRVMQEHNISQKDLAEKTGKSGSYISRILNGNANLTVKSMSVMADALGYRLHLNLAPIDHVVELRHFHYKDNSDGVSMFNGTDANLINKDTTPIQAQERNQLCLS